MGVVIDFLKSKKATETQEKAINKETLKEIKGMSNERLKLAVLGRLLAYMVEVSDSPDAVDVVLAAEAMARSIDEDTENLIPNSE